MKYTIIRIGAVIMFLAFFISILSLGGETKYKKSDYIDYDRLSKEDVEDITRKVNWVKDISESDKEVIAYEVFDEYINSNRTDWQQVKKDKLDRQPEMAVLDYNIKNVEYVGEGQNEFHVVITFDIRCTEQGTMWNNPNDVGEICDDGWIRNKAAQVSIDKYLDKYLIADVINIEENAKLNHKVLD